MMRFGKGFHSRIPFLGCVFAIVLAIILMPSSNRLIALQEPVVLASPSTETKKDTDETSIAGQQKLTIQVVEVSLPSTEFGKLDIDWTLADSTGLKSAAPKKLELENKPDRPSVEFTSAVKKNEPVLYANLSEEKTRAMLDSVPQNENVLQWPSVIQKSGQQVSMSSTIQKPYATGNKRVEVIDAGSKIELRATRVGSDSVKLQCDLSMADVRSVDKVEVKLSGGAKTFIEIPEVDTTTIQCALNIPLGNTLCITKLDAKATTRKLFLITCKIDGEQRRPATDAELKTLVADGIVQFNPPVGHRENPVSIQGHLEKDSDRWSSDPPSDDEILHAFERSRPQAIISADIQQVRNSARIETEKIHEVIEPIRFVPLVGNASLRHTLFKCKIAILSTELLTPTLDEESQEFEFFVEQATFRLAE